MKSTMEEVGNGPVDKAEEDNEVTYEEEEEEEEYSEEGKMLFNSKVFMTCQTFQPKVNIYFISSRGLQCLTYVSISS